ncbi:uncharacterized protein HNR44_001522 [Geomicrobium halophilum]|uniref:DUF418 domain-containing protein n=1 Tax=Geomicrobium halophilum TaxID=549000 RepID=A0A841PY87_9BACL|nr:DUF418 domain-containing protein [Geomicrobium halophilum]MBB6449573.1 uncharacterized protein [Geomicrobium halophilum]
MSLKSNKEQRIDILDQMRGLALLAIFLANVPGLAEVNTEGQSSVNQAVDDFLSIVLNDSARPLFAFMFGMSLMLIYNRLKKKDVNPYPKLLRRLLWLAFAGVIHGYAIWAGDILLMYAMAGFVLLLFMNLSATWLMTAALLFWLGYTVGMDLISYYSSYELSLKAWLNNLLLGPGESPTGTEYVINEFSSMVRHLGFFLFGMYAYREGFFSFIGERRKLMWVLSVVFLVVGFAGKISLYYDESHNPLRTLYPFVVTFGMILFIVLTGTSKTIISKTLLPFTAIGKMAFTNYLMQSLVFVSVFHLSGRSIFGGIGIWTEPTYLFALGIGVILFVAQMTFSHFWLKKFYYGPFEWLWRIGTYGRIVALKR